VRLVFSLVEAGEMAVEVFFLAIHEVGALRHLPAALFSDEGLQLVDPEVLDFHALLHVVVNAVVGLHLLLELDDSLVSLVQSGRKCDHDVSLFQKQVLVPVHLLLVFLDLKTFFFDLLDFNIVLLPDNSLSFFNGRSELRRVFNFLASNQHLAVHRRYFLFKSLLLFFFLKVLPAPEFQGSNSGVLVLLCSLPLLL